MTLNPMCLSFLCMYFNWHVRSVFSGNFVLFLLCHLFRLFPGKNRWRNIILGKTEHICLLRYIQRNMTPRSRLEMRLVILKTLLRLRPDVFIFPVFETINTLLKQNKLHSNSDKNPSQWMILLPIWESHIYIGPGWKAPSICTNCPMSCA